MIHMMRIISILQTVGTNTQEITERFCGLLHAHIQRTNPKESKVFLCKNSPILVGLASE